MRRPFLKPGTMAIVVAGVLLRIWYWIVTPVGTRSHDMGTHLDYVKYLATQWTLPSVNEGWEFHQAPLYYVFSGFLWWLNGALGLDQAVSVVLLRAISLLLTLATFAVALRVVWMLFKTQRERLTAGALLAAFPGLIYLGGEISNKTPHHFLIFLEFLLLLRWWKSGTYRDLILLSVMIGIGFLTKISSVVMIAALVCCILARSAMTASARWKSLGIATLILTLLCGWFVALRVSERTEMAGKLDANAQMELVANMRDSNNPAYFLQFSPVMILETPFNSLWDPVERRIFWEFFFRSVWFGEWAFESIQPLGTIILILGMLMLGLAFVGMGRDAYERPPFAFPIAVIAVLLPLALLAYRIVLPCTCNQDFRFISLFCVPMTYYALRGMGWLPNRLRILGEAIAWLSVLACAAFIIVI